MAAHVENVLRFRHVWRKDGYIDEIARTVIADERDADSEGMQLANAV